MNGKNATTIHTSWLMLKITYGLVCIVAGADKFFNFITYWAQYVSPKIAAFIPLSTMHLLYLVGIVEIAVGILILSKCTRIGAYLAAGWLFVIVINLLSMGMYYDIAVRDTVMAVGALVLAQLTTIEESK